MIASLMMYNHPELSEANNRFWGLVHRELLRRNIPSPTELSQDADEFALWNSPELLLSQTCGMPYRLWLADKVSLVGTLDYGLKNCPTGYYYSLFIVRKDKPQRQLQDYQNATFAYNQKYSQSGYAAAYHHAQSLGFCFNKLWHSGAHLQSALAVAEGKADIAALDAVSWRSIKRYEPWSAKLRIIAKTTPTPALPLITAQHDQAEPLFQAVENAISHLAENDLDRLGITRIVKIPKHLYLQVPNPPK